MCMKVRFFDGTGDDSGAVSGGCFLFNFVLVSRGAEVMQDEDAVSTKSAAEPLGKVGGGKVPTSTFETLLVSGLVFSGSCAGSPSATS